MHKKKPASTAKNGINAQFRLTFKLTVNIQNWSADNPSLEYQVPTCTHALSVYTPAQTCA